MCKKEDSDLPVSHLSFLHSAFISIHNYAVLQIRWGNRDDLGTIFHIFPLKHIL